MSHSTNEPLESEKQRQEPGMEPRRDRRQPFDTSGLNDIPQPRPDDPPYRNWWVVDTGGK